MIKAAIFKVGNGFKAFFVGIAELFKNKDGQFSIEEVLKLLAAGAAVYIGYQFFFGKFVAEARPYFWQVETVLWGYALIQSVSHNITKQ